MNKTMQSMMKPIPVEQNNKGALRLAQEEHVLAWLRTIDHSVNCRDVYADCHDIPGVNGGRWGGGYYEHCQCSSILKRLEKKGHVVSVLYGQYRYYSIPVENGGEN